MVRDDTGQRRTKKDLKRKMIARGYKRGGQFRSMNVSELAGEESDAPVRVDRSKSKKKKF